MAPRDSSASHYGREEIFLAVPSCLNNQQMKKRRKPEFWMKPQEYKTQKNVTKLQNTALPMVDPGPIKQIYLQSCFEVAGA